MIIIFDRLMYDVMILFSYKTYTIQIFQLIYIYIFIFIISSYALRLAIEV